MRAAVLRGGSVEARIIDDPVPGPGQLLVRSLACGICASDIHFMDHPEAGADDDSGMSITEGGRKIIGQNPESPGGVGEDFLLTAAPTRVVNPELPGAPACRPAPNPGRRAA